MVVTEASFGNKIKDSAFAFLVPGIPILNRRVFNLRTVKSNEFYYRSMQLVFISWGGRTAFQITHIAAFISYHKSALKLSRTRLIDAEIGGQFHGTLHSFGDITERTVWKYGRIQSGKVIILRGNDGTDILPNQLWMFLNGFWNGAKDNPFFRQGFFECRCHGYGIHHDIDSYSR